jgi:hypothetical protein
LRTMRSIVSAILSDLSGRFPVFCVWGFSVKSVKRRTIQSVVNRTGNVIVLRDDSGRVVDLVAPEELGGSG